MDLAIVEEAKKLPAGEAELLCAKNGIEFHPVVCDAVTAGGCKHVSHEQRIEREAAYAKASGKSVAVVAEEGKAAAVAAPDIEVVGPEDDVVEEHPHVASPKKKKTSGHK